MTIKQKSNELEEGRSNHKNTADDPPKYTDHQPTTTGSIKHLVPQSQAVSSQTENGQIDSSSNIEPPDFSIYQASYTIDSIGDIISHDPHLNSDGEALCRFILLHTSSPPSLIVKLSGSHEDERIETTTEYVDGRTEYRTREQRTTVTDFSFNIQVPSNEALDHGVRELYVVSDGEVVSRGGHRRTRGKWENGKDLSKLNQESTNLNLPGRGVARVGFKERRKSDKIAKEVQLYGYVPFIPPWMFPKGCFTREPTRPPDDLLEPNWPAKSKQFFDSLVYKGYYRQRKLNQQASIHVERELREWCDDYCSNKKCLKEFCVKKQVFGWNLALLEEGLLPPLFFIYELWLFSIINSFMVSRIVIFVVVHIVELMKLLKSIPHLRSTQFSVDFQLTSSKITIRPVNMISKILSLGGLSQFILTLTLIYPILWLMKYLMFGGEYDVIRVGYPLVYWKNLDETLDLIIPTSDEELVGETEQGWLRKNRDRISIACQNCKIGIL